MLRTNVFQVKPLRCDRSVAPAPCARPAWPPAERDTRVPLVSGR
jgi:hypothetical protein